MALTARHVRELFDWQLALAAAALVAIGIAGIWSATGQQMTDGTHGPAVAQAVWAGVALLGAAVAIGLPVRFWYGMAYVLYVVCVAGLVLTALFGSRGMGAERWLVVGPLRVQVSEIGKIGLILALGRYLSGRKVSVTSVGHLMVVVGLVVVPVALVRVQPDLGTAMVYLAIAIPVAYWGGLKNLHLFLILTPIVNAVCAFAGWVPWAFFFLAFVASLVLMRPSLPWIATLVLINLAVAIVTPTVIDGLRSFQRRRIETFFSPEKDPLGAGYQIIQSKVAIGSGGMWGKGYQQGSQTQLAFLPETHTDFIFAVLGEEFGFVGAMVVLGLLLLVIWRTMTTALIVDNRFASFVCIGVASMLAFHCIVNIGMTVGLMPVTGLPLPLVSYGGSALTSHMFALGLVLGFGLRRYE
jgi:rod shape determining protein RodA